MLDSTGGSILLILISLLIWRFYNKLTYWKRKGVKSPNLFVQFVHVWKVILKRLPLSNALEVFLKEFPDEKIVGIYQGLTPLMLPNDHEVVKNILIKNFECFTDRGFGLKSDLFSANIFQLDGDDWRVVRQRLSPIFTSGKLKNMFPLIAKSAKGFVSYIEKRISDKEHHEIRDITSMYTLDSIGSCAFGVDVDAFSEGDNIYRRAAERMMNVKITVMAKVAIDRFCPILLPLFKIRRNPFPSNLFYSLVKQGVKEREGKTKVRNDLMDFLVQMKEDGEVKGDMMKVNNEHNIEVTEKFIASQVFTFYGAGFEPASAAISFLLYEMALNPDVQEKLRKEIDETAAKYNGEFTYEAILDMKYLDMVFSETVRKYPAADIIFRQCVRDCVLPENGVKIEKGTCILISLKNLHNNPKFFPNPKKFDPERFSPENKIKIPTGAYIPFGDGPRMCIGLRYAKVLCMLAAATTLKNFIITRTEKTMENLDYECRSFLILSLISRNGVWVRFTKRE